MVQGTSQAVPERNHVTNRARSTTRIAAGLAALSLGLAACSGGGSSDGEGDGGEDLTVTSSISQDVDTLLPMDANVGDNIAVLDVIYDGLVRYDPETTEPYPYLAEEITTTDNQVWTIKIKPGTTFHNGEPVDAEAFARAWNYAAYGPNAMGNNYFFERIEGYDDMQGEYEEADDGTVTVDEEPAAEELSGLEVVDPQTLQVTLTAPFVGFDTMLGYTGFFPIAQACLDDIEACTTKPIGNGPFQVEEWSQGQSLTATKYADYTGAETPNYDRIEWVEYAGGSEWPDFQAGLMDLAEAPSANFTQAYDDPALQRVERPTAALTYLSFPLYDDGPWTDIEFRKALSMAIDRQAVIDAVLPGQRVPADSWVMPDGVPGGVAGTCGEACTFNPEAAKAALEAAGGWPEGETMTIHLGVDETEQELFQAIGDQITLNLGIPYELDPTPDFFDRRSNRDFSGPFRSNWFPDYPLNENYLGPVYASDDAEEGNTNFGYYNEDFNNAIADGDSAATLDEAVTNYQEAERILAEDFPTAPLFYTNVVLFHSDRVSNVVIDPFSGRAKMRLLEVTG